MGTTQDREHEQAGGTEQGDYAEIAVADDRYKVGTEVRIIKDDPWHNVNASVLGRSGTVISCVRERNDHSYYVVVYAFIDEFKACGPKVVVKGTLNSFCTCGDEVQQMRDHSGWCVWSYPHPEH